MPYPTSRVIVYDRGGNREGDISPEDIQSRVRTEELNGEHSLVLTTKRRLDVGMRLLTVDSTGKWREWVVSEPDEEHANGSSAIGKYHCIWSMQYDLETTDGGVLWASSEEGTNDPISASEALVVALTNSPMWRPGTCDVDSFGGASLYDDSAWSYLSKVVEVWGGEIDANIEVDDQGVVSRTVDLRAHLGESVAKRRFDWGSDLTEIRRTPDPGPYYCRVVPRGGGDATDSDGVSYSDRCGIEGWTKDEVRWKVVSVPEDAPTGLATIDDLWDNGFVLATTDDEATATDFDDLSVGDVVADPVGVSWVQDDDAAILFRTRMPDGTWFYPTKTVTYDLDTKEDEEELYYKALDDLHSHTRPGVTYEANVLQYAEAGLDPMGVALGDDVHVVDLGFDESVPLRLEGRIERIEVDEMSPSTSTELTIGNLGRRLGDAIRDVAINSSPQLSSLVSRMESGGAVVYLANLIEMLNAEANATGGYTYVTAGEGIVVYDIAVDDPLVGYNSSMDVWASRVVQVKGGTIRIADTKETNFSGINDWEWKSVFDSGHVAADMVVSANLVSGTIQSYDGSVYIDLDNANFRFGNLEDRIDDARRYATDYLTYENGRLILGATDSAVRNVFTNTSQVYETDAGVISSYGLNDEGIWELSIDNASIDDMLRFGGFAWIKRQNGNMTLKWLGA